MSEADAPAPTSIRIRLDRETRKRLECIAAYEHRSVANYVQRLIDRDLKAREEAARVIHVFVAPELADAPFGVVGREEGESEEEYAERAAALDTLFQAR